MCTGLMVVFPVRSILQSSYQVTHELQHLQYNTMTSEMRIYNAGLPVLSLTDGTNNVDLTLASLFRGIIDNAANGPFMGIIRNAAHRPYIGIMGNATQTFFGNDGQCNSLTLYGNDR